MELGHCFQVLLILVRVKQLFDPFFDACGDFLQALFRAELFVFFFSGNFRRFVFRGSYSSFKKMDCQAVIPPFGCLC